MKHISEILPVALESLKLQPLERWKKGDKVVIKKEFEGDGTEHTIVEWNGDRGIISPSKWEHGTIIPTELVRDHMIEVSVELMS